MQHRRLRSYAILTAKLVLAAALLVYLVIQAQQNESFERLVEQPKRWSLLAAAVGLMATIAVVSFFRWFLLVRALGLDFTIADAMRLGSLGYVLNLVSLGSVGGDLFKAVLIAKGQPGKRTEAVATVLLDRIVGLYALLLVAAGAVLLSDVRSRGPGIAAMCNATVACAAIATIGLAVLMVPAITSPRTEAHLARMPLVGSTAARLLAAVRVYRNQPLVVLIAVLISIGLHVTLVTVVLAIAHGLPGDVPSWSDHFVLVPLSMVAGSIPITPNGLGTLELAMDTLYLVLGRAQGVVQGTGTIVAFGYRLANIVVACGAAIYYVVVSGRLPKFDAEVVSGP
jgi:uncharacterized protein (TIRG00374 family)